MGALVGVKIGESTAVVATLSSQSLVVADFGLVDGEALVVVHAAAFGG